MTAIEELRRLLAKLPNPKEWLCDACNTVFTEMHGQSLTGLNCRCGKGLLRPSSFNERRLERDLAAAAESMHSQAITISELRQQLTDASNKVAAVPVAEPNMVWNADDLEEGGYSPDEFADYVAPSLGEESVFNVAVAISLPNRTMRVWREEDADGHHEVKWEWAGMASSADSIPRARLDELLAAEGRLTEFQDMAIRNGQQAVLLGERVQELEAVLSAFVEYAEACNDDSPELYRARAALAASKEPTP